MGRRPEGLVLAAAVAVGALGAAPPPAPVRFVDVAREAGLTFVHVAGTPEKRHIVESTGGGACFLDYDLDGDLDLYLVNGATLGTRGADNPARDALYENLGGGRFRDVTAEAGVGDPGWGGACAVADYDDDGDPDLYVTNWGPNVLYRNQGDGTFRDVTAAAGVGDPRWSLGAAFFDADRDGDLDLYVANYLAFDAADPEVLARRCNWKGGEVMCGPRGFAGQPDALYLNRGDGTFEPAPPAAGVGADALYGMGVVAGDLDGDGDPDLFVANDSQENLLLINDGAGRFADGALAAGVSLSGDGRQQAGMGADLGDVDGDGDQDLFVTNFSDDYHTLYRNEGDLFFTDISAAAGLDPATRASLGWGGGFLDYDNDGDLDLFVAGGHVYPGVEEFDPATGYRQRNLLFENDGRGRFTEVTARAGSGFAVARNGRGAAFGDYDDDGDLDVVVVNDGEPPSLLRNDGGNGGHWLKLRLVGRRSNRDGVGAWIRVHARGRVQAREARTSAGYCSAHDPRLHFGLGAATIVERVEIRWPSGVEQTLDALPADHLVTVDEERGVVAIARLPVAGRAMPAPPEPGVSPERAAAPGGLRSEPAAGAPAAAGPSAGAARRLTPADVRRVDAWLQSGTRDILAGRYGEGIEDYRRVLAALPPWEAAAASPDALGFGDRERYRALLAAVHDNLGVGLMRAERLAECAAPIERALALTPGRAKFLHNLGLCHFHGRRYPEAVAALEAAARAGEPSPGLRYDAGRALAATGRCDEAIAELGAAIAELPRPDLRGRDAEAWYHQGDCLADRGWHGEAAAAFREVLARVPGHQKALYRLAFALRRGGEPAAAERAERLFAARQPADEAVRALKRSGAAQREGRLLLGRGYLAAGLATEALQEAQMLLAGDPRDAAAQTLHGQALLELRPPAVDAAGDAFARAVALAPGDAEALAGLGEALRRKGDRDGAAERFEAALARAPGEVTATIGLARLAGGAAGPALARLEALAEARPSDPAVLAALAGLYLSAPEGAARHARRALELLARARDLYGEGEETRVRALALAGERDQARLLLAASPFFGRAERAALAPLVE